MHAWYFCRANDFLTFACCFRLHESRELDPIVARMKQRYFSSRSPSPIELAPARLPQPPARAMIAFGDIGGGKSIKLLRSAAVAAAMADNEENPVQYDESSSRSEPVSPSTVSCFLLCCTWFVPVVGKIGR